jgi:protease-4
MTGVYELFLARVAEGRNIPVERVAASAEGRIFGGRDGVTRGLVDEIGGLAEAIARARSMAGLAPDARFAVAGEASGLLQALGDDDPPNAGNAGNAARSVAPLAGLGAVALELVPFVESLLPLAQHERALCAMPFALTVR